MIAQSGIGHLVATVPLATSRAVLALMVTSPVATVPVTIVGPAPRGKNVRAQGPSMASSVPSVLVAIAHLGIVPPVATGLLVIARKASVLTVTSRPASPSARSRAAASRLAVSLLESPAVRADSQASPVVQVARLAVQRAVVPVAAAPAGVAPGAERADAR